MVDTVLVALAAGACLFVALLVYCVHTYLPLPWARARPASGERHECKAPSEATALRTIVFHTQGDMSSPRVVLIPSLGREASDFNELAAAIASDGYRTLALEPPGINGCSMQAGGITTFDLAGDVFAALDHDGGSGSKAVVLGHAFGNRVARAAAALHPTRIPAVILVAAGGDRPPPAAASEALRNVFNPYRSSAARLVDVRAAFFFRANPVPPHWRRGWHYRTAAMQWAAGAATNAARDRLPEYLGAGGRPMLILQAENDAVAPSVDAAERMLSLYPDQVTIHMVPMAGHALLPEQPHTVQTAVLRFLARHCPPAATLAAARKRRSYRAARSPGRSVQ